MRVVAGRWQVHGEPTISLETEKQTFTPRKLPNDFFVPSHFSDSEPDRKTPLLQSGQEGQEASHVTVLVGLCNGGKPLEQRQMGNEKSVRPDV